MHGGWGRRRGELLTIGGGANPELVLWCQEHFPGVGGNATYYCKDRNDVRDDATMGGLLPDEAADCLSATGDITPGI